MFTMVSEIRINSPKVEVSVGEDSGELYIHLPTFNQGLSPLNNRGNSVVNNDEESFIVHVSLLQLSDTLES